jgi:nucleotide-binding universal stress UspA family protein
VVGNPAEVITDFSREYHHDLIVMGKIKNLLLVKQLCRRR